MDFSFITYKYFDVWNAQTVLFTIITVIIERVELMQQRKNEKKTLQRPSVHIFFLHSRHNQREKLEFHCWGKCSCNWYFAWWKQRSRQFQQSAPHTHFKLRGDLGAFGLTKEKIKQSSSRRKWYKKSEQKNGRAKQLPRRREAFFLHWNPFKGLIRRQMRLGEKNVK